MPQLLARLPLAIAFVFLVKPKRESGLSSPILLLERLFAYQNANFIIHKNNKKSTPHLL